MTSKCNAPAPQQAEFLNGNESAAWAIAQIDVHVMGYFPITPSTAIAETLDAWYASGKSRVRLIPADGEHGAAGICYGASLAGGRVTNATSANGLLYSLEQLPVQSGTRAPMVLNVVCRTVSGPLDIKGDHSDLMYTLNTGWIILAADTPQAVYDLNIVAVRIAEAVALPVIVASDGFFTSHQLHKIQVFAEDQVVRDFVGPVPERATAIDRDNPITMGPYMNEPDLINNRYQQHLAMEDARVRLPEILAEYGAISGREYQAASGYRLEDAEVVIFVLNSAYSAVMVAVDNLRAQGHKVGGLTLRVIRPFPAAQLRKLLAGVLVLVVCDRQDSYGSDGGNMSKEIKAALQGERDNQTKVLSRVYGLGGKEFPYTDAQDLLNEALSLLAGESTPAEFDYVDTYAGDLSYQPQSLQEPIPVAETDPGLLSVTYDQEQGRVTVKGASLRELTRMPRRVVSGHGACPGCGIFPNLNTFLKGITGDIVLLFHTGCGMVVSTGYPHTSFRVTYVHNLFQNGAATLSGMVEMFHERRQRGEISVDDDFTFILVTGDGGNDIGMGPTIGTALRNHGCILYEYDNAGYMNTGYQLSYSTPYCARTATSNVGKNQKGKANFHKDTPQIMAGTHMPYIATMAESHQVDMIRKAAKAQYYAQHFGTVYVKVLSACPLNWKDEPRFERNVIQKAVECNYYPLYEIEQGVTKLTYRPGKKEIPVKDWLGMMGRTKHLMKPENAKEVELFQAEVTRRYRRLVAMDENELL